MIEVENVRKRYGEKPTVDGLDFVIQSGAGDRPVEGPLAFQHLPNRRLQRSLRSFSFATTDRVTLLVPR
ncbi:MULTISPECIES: hypothetical protein [unclassified Frankia]|uniref:hypothetical protein n=1 Tax=unclassified Frankia TaxID=2632575 RepID=UPI002AD2AD07|nr:MULTISPECIES: hypothetical protein [unclassified Frankia]